MRLSLRPLVTLIASVALVTCGESATGPVLSTENVAVAVTAPPSLQSLADFGLSVVQAHVVVTGASGAMVRDTLIAVTPASAPMTIELPVSVSASGATFTVAIDFMGPTGIVLFHGDVTVTSHPGHATTASELVIRYVGPGAAATRIAVSPATAAITGTGSVAFTAAGFDGATPDAGVPIRWTTSDTTIATIASTGVLRATGRRGTAIVVAETPSGLRETAVVTVTPAPAGMMLVSGGGQSGRVGAALAAPAVVRVVAADGLGIAGITVTFVAPPGGGAASPSSAVTDANGNASTALTLGPTAGAQGFTATAGTFSVAIPETGTAGPAAAIAAISGGGQTGHVGELLPVPMTVKVSDAAGNVVSGATVTWSATNGAVTTATTTTDALGATSNTMTLGGELGAATVTAGLASGTSATFSATAVAGRAARLVFVVQPAGGTAGAPLTPRVQIALQDSLGHLAASTNPVTVALGAGTTGVTLAGTLTRPAVAGIAVFDDLSLDKAGTTFTLTATSAGLTTATSSAFDVTAGAASTLTIVAGDGQAGVVGTALSIRPSVRLADAHDNPVAGVIVSFTPAIGSGTPAPGTVTTDAQGIASPTSWTLGTTAGAQSLVATAPDLPSVTFHATAQAGQAATIAVRAGDAQSGRIGEALASPLVVMVTDAAGNPVAGTTIAWVATNSTLAAATSTTDAAGQASNSLTLGTATGAASATATLPNGMHATFAANVGAGAVAKLAFRVQPSNGTAGAALAPALQVVLQDSVGNTVTTSTAPVTLAIGTNAAGATLTGTLTRSAVAGVATFGDVTVDKAGTGYTVTASSAGADAVTSTTFGIGAASAAALSITAGDNQSAAVNAALPVALSVRVADAHGNPVAGVAVTWSRTGAGVLSATTTTTSTAGTASVGYTLGAVAGSETIVATAAGVATSVTFTAHATAGSAAAIASVSGGGQTGRVGAVLPAPMTVKVTDASGNAVAGAAVTWSVTNGTVPSATTTTDAQGVTFTAVTLGSTPGTATITASIAGGASTSVTATVTAGIATHLVFRVQPASGTAAAALTPAIQIALQDSVGNTVTTSAAPVTLAIGTNAGGATLAGTLTRNAVAGVATFNDLTLNRAGVAYTLTAASEALPPATSTTFDIVAGTAAGLAIVAGEGQTTTVNGAVAVAPSVKVTDASGNAVAGVAVTFVPAGGSGSVAPATSIATNAQGVATLSSWTLGTTAGAQSLAASAPGLPGVTFHATAAAGAASQMIIVTQPSSSATSGSALGVQPVLQLRDQFGNAAPGGSIQVTASPSIGSASGTVVTANGVTGLATFTGLTLVGTGSATITFSASATGIPAVTSTVVTIAPGAPATMTVLDGSTNAVIAAGQAITINATAGIAPASPPVIRITDASGQPVSGVAVTFTATGPAPFSETLASDGSGLVPFARRIRIAGSYTVTASTSPALTGSPRSASVVVATAPASALAISGAPTGVQAGIATSLSVRVTDSIGNIITAGPGSTETITLAIQSGPAGATLSGQTASAVAGVAQFTALRFSSAGSYLLAASSAPAGLATDTPTTIAVGASPTIGGLRIVAAPPTNATNNVVFGSSTSVQLLDAAGNPLALANAQVTMTPVAAPGSPVAAPVLLAGTSTSIFATTDGSGLATFTNIRAVGLAQTFTVRFAADAPGAIVSSANIALGVGAATHLVKASGDDQSALIGATLPVAVAVQQVDTLGQAVATPTTTVAYTIVAGGGSATPSVTTNGSGTAATSWTLGATEGANSLRADATIGGVPQSLTFSATASDVHAMTFAATPAGAQTNGQPLSPQPSIQMTDGAGHALPKSGIVVTATIGTTAGGTDPALSLTGTVTATSDASGRATFATLGALGPAGTARLTFTVTSGTTQSISAITNDITLAAGAPVTATRVSPALATAAAGSPLASGDYPKLRFTDVAGAPVANAAGTSVTFSVTGGSCSVGASPVPVDANGEAALSSGTLVLPLTPGSCVIHAVTSPALPSAPYDFTIVTTPVGALTWLGTTSGDFAAGSNWTGGVAPTAADAVFIPRFVPNTPAMQASASVAALTMEPLATLSVGAANTLTVAGSIDAATIASGTVVAVGTSSTIKGSFAALTFGNGAGACSYSLNATVTATGAVQLSSCSVDVNSRTLSIGGLLSVTGANGRLVMTDAAGHVTVAGSATFNGAAASGTMTAGTLDIAGNFTQGAATSSGSFAPTGTHLTRLIGTGAQQVSFASPTTSNFNDLTVTNASSSGTTIASTVNVARNFTMAGSAKLGGSGRRLGVGGAVVASSTSDLGGLDSLTVTGTTFPSYLNPTAGKAPRMTLLAGSSYTLTASATIAGGLDIGAGSSLTIGGRLLSINDSLGVDGHLLMVNSGGVVTVRGKAKFRGGASASDLTAGVLRLGGDVTENGTGTTAFAPAPGFLVQLIGLSTQTISFSNPGSSSSYFADLEIDNTSSNGVTFASNVFLTGVLEQKGRLTIPSGRTMTVAGTSSFRTLGSALPGAVTNVSGTLALGAADFYNASRTTGTGTVNPQAGQCRYGSTVTSDPNDPDTSKGVINVGTFLTITCTPGRGGPNGNLP